MIHNKQYYIDKYDKAWNKVKSEIEKRGEDPEVVGITDEWEQTATPEEIAGYYIEAQKEYAYETWLDNLSHRRENERELYEESDSEVTGILKDLEDLEVINNYIMEVADGNGKDSDSLINIHEYINRSMVYEFGMDYESNSSDVLLTNMSNQLLVSMENLTGEELDSIFLTYDYKTNKVSAYISSDYIVYDYPIELDKDTVEKVRELFEDAVKFRQTKGDDNVNETKKEITTETKGNTVYVTIYDAQEDPMLSSAGLRTTTEISFDNVRGITYEGEYCVIWYNDTKISFRIKEIAMITFSNK